MINLRAETFCWRNGSMADSSLRTVTGVPMLYSKRSAISCASPVGAIELNCGGGGGGRAAPPSTPLEPADFRAATCGAFKAATESKELIAPLETVGVMAW